MAKVKTPRWGWALTGSGHFFKECLIAVRALEDVVYPRRIDLENTERLKSFDGTAVVETLSELEQALARRKRELAAHG
jgi:flavoprotein